MTERAPWREQAECRGRSEVMYATGLNGEATALLVCRACPVQAECLASTMKFEGMASYHFRYGVAGGLTAMDRARLAHGQLHRLGAA